MRRVFTWIADQNGWYWFGAVLGAGIATINSDGWATTETLAIIVVVVAVCKMWRDWHQSDPVDAAVHIFNEPDGVRFEARFKDRAMGFTTEKDALEWIKQQLASKK